VLSAGYGDQVLLTAAARALATTLPPDHALRDLGRHRLRDLLEAEHIYQLIGSDLPDRFPPLKSLDQKPHNLPSQPTELIGRESELEQIQALLAAPGARLVTLTGPGGTGKTRLAVQAAANLLDAFPDGVWWVPLATVTEPALVLEAIATTLGVREQAGQPLMATLVDHVRARQMLLVLDNLEQVLAVGPLLAEVLAAAPGVVILATSREPLRLRGERESPVAPLSLPPVAARVSLDGALASPAVQLFLARAQAIKSDFTLTEENAAAIVAICQRLDGLPLAIELAAARVRLLAPAALLARLEKRLPLLTGGARDLPERQQTLRAAIAWSYDLLSHPERALFARLAVFSGGCTFAAALAVADAGSDLAIDLLDGLDSLVQKSLLRQSDELRDEPRFTMLETIREFGLEQLAAEPAVETAVRSAHAAFYRETVDAAIDSEDQVSAYGALELESGNIRAALDWYERHEESTTALEFATNLRWFWWVRGHLREGLARLETALRTSATAPPQLRAKALSGLGLILESGGEYTRAKNAYTEALHLYREAGDEPGIAEALDNLGAIAEIEGDLGASESLAEEALALRRALGNKREIAGSLINLGNLAYLKSDIDCAIDYYEEARLLGVETGDQLVVAMALGNTGDALHRKAESLAASETNPETVANMKSRAAELARQAVGILRSFGDRERILNNLLVLADITAPSEPRHAALLLGAAESLAAATGHHLTPIDQEHHDSAMDSVRASLGDAMVDSATRAGKRLTL
ncbi:MAG: ATP-binding protein, partial [Thermomicrobiales bacterium]